jgi:hypothetical protein
MSAYVSSKDWESSIELTDRSPVYWSGEPVWIDDRWLCIRLENSVEDQSTDKNSSPAWRHRLALYDAKTGCIRPVYESLKMIEAAVCKDRVAILEKVGDSARIVISEWNKTPDGIIVCPKYVPSDAPENPNYLKFILHPDKPLKKVR